jgi:hypothetical protein
MTRHSQEIKRWRPHQKATKRRSRRNKHQVGREKWGGVVELVTCGSTPGQLERIREATATGDAAKQVVRSYLKGNIGYDQLSYLTEEEAAELLEMLAKFVTPAPEPGQVATEQQPAQDQPQPGETDATVYCPIYDKDMSVGSFCMTECPTRQGDGFCPIVDELSGQEVI